MGQRNRYLDILRGLAIVLMVFGHCIQYGNGTEFIKSSGYFDNTLFALIYSFHMPLFMILSGYLFYYTVRKYQSHKEFIKNRWNRIILPIIGWQTVHYLLLGSRMIVNKEPITLTFVYLYFRSWLRDNWFLHALLYCSVIIYIVRKCARDSIFIYFMIFAFCFITPDYFFVNTELYKYVYPCFLCGYMYSIHEEKIKRQLNRLSLIKWFGILGICFIFLFSFWVKDAYIYTSGFTLLGRENMLRQFLIDMYRFLIGFIGCGLFMVIVRILYNWNPIGISALERVRKGIDFCQKIMEKIGQKALFIYALSSEMVHLILEQYSDYFHFSYVGTVIETVIFILVCYLLAIGVSKIFWLNRFLQGGR